MLPKVNRLKKNKDFERVFKKGKGFKEGLLILKLVPNELEQARFGIVVSQKVSKKAVLRNKIKRRIGELVKSKLVQIKKGIDVILIAAPGLGLIDFQEIEKILNKLFIKAKILKSFPPAGKEKTNG
ncbi:ribonuclease P protein component [Patescibacteria group bacterium]|nr:ribonuclease P protein component [Patescibacteria group bacterium]